MQNEKSERKLAILIDAENVSYKYIKVILDEATSLGDVIHKRIYGDWTGTTLSSWKSTIIDYSIQPVQQFSYTTGKNASDSCMIIEAMDLLFQGKMDGFCIVSSDSDFTRLAARLRESEMYVVGMGERKTPRSFVSACSKFSYLDLLYSEEEEAKISASHSDAEKTAGADINTIKKVLRQIIDDKSDDEGWVFSGSLGDNLNKKVPDFDVRNFGYRKLVPFLQSLNMLDVKRDEKDHKLVFFKLK